MGRLKLFKFSQMVCYILAAVIAVALFAQNSTAQDATDAKAKAPDFSLTVRAGVHDTYARLVFDWNDIVGYRVEDKDGMIRIAFDTPADVKLPDVSKIIRLNSISLAKNNLLDGAITQINVETAKDSRIRHFRLGKKIVLDVMGPQEKKVETEEQKKPVAREPEKQVT